MQIKTGERFAANIDVTLSWNRSIDLNRITQGRIRNPRPIGTILYMTEKAEFRQQFYMNVSGNTNNTVGILQ